MTAQPDDPYEVRARLLRILAGVYRKKAAEYDLAASAVLATRSAKPIVDAILRAEAREFAEHPDIAEALAQLEGFYGDDQPDPEV